LRKLRRSCRLNLFLIFMIEPWTKSSTRNIIKLKKMMRILKNKKMWICNYSPIKWTKLGKLERQMMKRS
jgi:hypothetical protein